MVVKTALSSQDHYYMAYALKLAERGLWTTDPNPRVGCVIVNNGEIVGEGWHEVAGEPHAEIHALRMAKEKAQGATCYVTLEPCCHHGRTPPCTDALIKAGITRVVSSCSDPNPLVERKGFEQLQRAGITVHTGILSQQAEQLNVGFFTRMRHNRPFIRCKMAMSLDGRTAMASGESQWITAADARRDVQGLRARSSAIMTGAGTVLADNPRLTLREEDLPIYMHKPKIIRQPLRVVVDVYLSMSTDAKMLTEAGQTVIFTISTNETIKSALEKAGAKVIVLPSRSGEMDLHEVCRILAEQYQVNELLLETGATLSGAMLRAKLIDEIVVYVAPTLMGSKARPLFNLPNIESLNQQIRLDIKDIRAVGQDWRITATPIYHE